MSKNKFIKKEELLGKEKKMDKLISKFRVMIYKYKWTWPTLIVKQYTGVQMTRNISQIVLYLPRKRNKKEIIIYNYKIFI